MSSVLPKSGANILGIIGFPLVGHIIGSTVEYGDTTSSWDSESRLVPTGAEPDIVCIAPASLVPSILEILETRMM